ncbi:Nn.00g030650.m01.CDS01 [Neocucurbitaria sp. VM-36]
MATEPPQTPPKPKERKERNVLYGYGFGRSVPAKSLPFPAHANLTVVELLTFLPNSIRCADVIYRLVSNGGIRQTIWAIANTNRDLPVEFRQNCCGTWMYKAMNEAGYEGWTIQKHDRFHNGRRGVWNEANLDVAGFQSPSQCKDEHNQAPGILFGSLAVDVRAMPQGVDALDLTRMVQYCIQNPNESWIYPRDYAALLGLLGGPATVRKEHFDRAAFERWAGVVPPPPRPQATYPPRWLQEEPRKEKRKRLGSAEADTPASGRSSVQSTPAPGILLETGRRPRGRPRKSIRTGEAAIPEPMHNEEVTTAYEPYIRGPAKYIAPPNDVAGPADNVVNLAFLEEGAPSENDPFSPYAFAGPRCSPPYRMLHRITQPDTEDNSGWAENLRWASEQRVCFGHILRTDAWNESSEHMEYIAEIRKEQLWASDELVELLTREQIREEEDERELYYPGKR